jgi:hypothetical protein
MARQISQIQQQILDQVITDPDLSPVLTSTSKRAIYRLWAFITAVAIGMLEQLMDIFSAAVEATVAKGAPASAAWIQDRIFKFQYSADVPQIIQLVDLAPTYPVVDPSLRIITRCSVTTNIANNVIVKVAKGEPPQALSPAQLSAVQSYVDTIGAAGVSYNVISTDPDLLYIQGQVFYNGQYSDVISANVLQSINAFLAALPFNGQMRISSLELAIRNVTGVTDVLLQNVSARAYNTAFGGIPNMILNNQVISRLWPTVSGYMIPETTAGNTPADTLQFIPE